MHRKRARRILGDLKKVSWVESCGPKKKVDFRELAMALWRVPHVWGQADGKASIERLYLSLLMSKNSKVIKSFVPELRSRKCFSSYGIFMFYVIYEHFMNIIRTFHVFIYGYVTVFLEFKIILNEFLLEISNPMNLYHKNHCLMHFYTKNHCLKHIYCKNHSLCIFIVKIIPNTFL